MTNELSVEDAIELLKEKRMEINYQVNGTTQFSEALKMGIKALEQQTCEDKGEISDGYHTFNQLYHQRAILFATIVNQNKDKAWKSFKHSDGHYCFDEDGEWFIVGVDTPQGNYTYHYTKEYWDMFDCQELECGKEWDGHTEEDVTRLLSLEQQPCEDCISREEALKAIEEEKQDWGNTGVEAIDGCLEAVGNLPSVTPSIPEVEDNFDIGYNCGYADAMCDIGGEL